MTIIGVIQYQNLSGGFWGIIGDDGQKWRPENLPQELQKEGLKVSIEAKKSKALVSLFMWGTAIKISDFKILELDV